MLKSMCGEGLLVVSYAIMIIAVAGVAAISIAYYQFFYVPDVAANIANPPRTTIIRIVEGASLESNPEFMVPKTANLTLGINNHVSLINEDYVPHVIISDTAYKDPLSGELNSLVQVEGGFILPTRTFEFTFTEPGEYGYRHEPHPWVHGMIIVEEP